MMTKIDKVKNSAYMVLNDFAFCFDRNDDGSKFITVYNLKNVGQCSLFIIGKDLIRLKSSNMSEANKYKSLFIIERNKEGLRRGYAEWESTQKSE